LISKSTYTVSSKYLHFFLQKLFKLSSTSSSNSLTTASQHGSVYLNDLKSLLPPGSTYIGYLLFYDYFILGFTNNIAIEGCLLH